MSSLVLPRLEIPPQAELLYENIAINDPDRSGNWRFYFRDDGGFFNARNKQLFITDPAQLKSGDAAFYWNTAFPQAPDRHLTPPQHAALRAALHEANFPALATHYAAPVHERLSHPAVERWTLVDEGKTYTVVVAKGHAPKQLVQLRAAIDELVAKAS